MDSFFPDKMSCVSPTDSIVTSPSGQPQLTFKPVKSPTGINITKSYLFKCEAPCSQKFMKLMIVELSHEEAQELSRFKVQQLFNSSLNQSHRCPSCKIVKKSMLVLHENLIIGNTDQLDYKDVYLQSNDGLEQSNSNAIVKRLVKGEIEMQISEDAVDNEK